MWARCLLWATVGLGAACAAGGRDVTPESHDVVVDRPSETHSSAGYEYIARRPLAVVALAEGRGLPDAQTHAAINRLADTLDTCMTERAHKGLLKPGAARVVAEVGANGEVASTQLRIDPGPGVAEVALLGRVAPARRLTFEAADAGGRGLAVEALWGELLPASDSR
jgi:hypothetical protein